MALKINSRTGLYIVYTRFCLLLALLPILADTALYKHKTDEQKKKKKGIRNIEIEGTRKPSTLMSNHKHKGKAIKGQTEVKNVRPYL